MKAVGRMVREGERSVARWSIVCESVRMYVHDYEHVSPHGEC